MFENSVPRDEFNRNGACVKNLAMIAGDLHLEMTVRMVEKILAAAVLSDPIDHLVIDEFLPSALAEQLSSEFVSYNDPNWHAYKNSIEDKKTCNQWNLFPPQTYQYFCAVCSDVVSKAIASKFGIEAEADIGLHGGGQHIHARMGNLNPHLDYSIHPKSGKERRLNAIYYLTDQHTRMAAILGCGTINPKTNPVTCAGSMHRPSTA